jgi:hypothetical protein
MSSALMVVSVVPLAASAAATAIWSVRTSRGPRQEVGPVRAPAQGVGQLDVAAVLAVVVAAAGLLVLSVRDASQAVSFERSIEYTGLVFLLPAAGWRVLRMVRPGRTALDRLSTVAPAVTGCALLVAGLADGSLSVTTVGFIAAGLLALAGSMLQNRR